MIPSSPIVLAMDDPAGVAGYPSLDDLYSDTLDGNRLYDPGILDAGWDDVIEAITVEAGLIAAADAGSSTAAEFDALLDRDLEDWQELVLGTLDVGIAGAVLALSAAGCATSSSCRANHVGRSSDFVVPEVVFWTTPERAHLVRAVASDAGCAFGVDEDGRASVWAPSLAEMMTLARELLARRATFDGLPVPPYRRS
jgi:hypothetical protein